MDLIMPEVDGITATQQIRRELPDVEHGAHQRARGRVGGRRGAAGAIGYLLKDTKALSWSGDQSRCARPGQLSPSRRAADARSRRAGPAGSVVGA
jgi:hypothetical protein